MLPVQLCSVGAEILSSWTTRRRIACPYLLNFKSGRLPSLSVSSGRNPEHVTGGVNCGGRRGVPLTQQGLVCESRRLNRRPTHGEGWLDSSDGRQLLVGFESEWEGNDEQADNCQEAALDSAASLKLQ